MPHEKSVNPLSHSSSSPTSATCSLEEEEKSLKSPSDIIMTGYTSPIMTIPSPSSYQKLPIPKETYLAYVVAIRDPLNLHLDIYWPPKMEERYTNAIKYDYSFVSEELESQEYVRLTYACHLRGVEIISPEPNDFSNMKEAYILISKSIQASGGWVLVTVSDIDVYRRILVNVFNIVTRQSLNHELLNRMSSRTNLPIAQEYTRPVRSRNNFIPNANLPKDYHIVFSGSPDTYRPTTTRSYPTNNRYSGTTHSSTSTGVKAAPGTIIKTTTRPKTTHLPNSVVII